MNEMTPTHNHRPKPSLAKQIIFSLVVVVATLAIGRFFVMMRPKSEAAGDASTAADKVSVTQKESDLMDLKTETVAWRMVRPQLKTSGQVYYQVEHTVNVSPRLQGRIRQLFVHLGDRVRQGQPIALMESPDGIALRTTLLQAENKAVQAAHDYTRQQALFRLGTPDVTAAQAALDQAKIGTKTAKDVLDTTLQQDRIGGFAEKPLEDATNALITAQSTYEQARSDFELASKDYARKKQLVQIGVAAQSDLETSADNYQKAQSAYQAAEKGLHLAQAAQKREKAAFDSKLYSKQQVQGASNAYQQALAQQAAAAKAYELAKAQLYRDLSAAKLAYESAELDLKAAKATMSLQGSPRSDGTYELLSPSNGVVTALSAGTGQAIDQSQMTPWELMTISDDQKVYVDADVYEKDISKVDLGAKVRLNLISMPGVTVEGKVASISPLIDKTSRSFKVRMILDNAGHRFKDGEFADVLIEYGKPRKAIVLPLKAISHEGDNDFVYLSDGKSFTRHQVMLGELLGDGVEIASGLTGGEVIATSGAIFIGSKASGN